MRGDCGGGGGGDGEARVNSPTLTVLGTITWAARDEGVGGGGTRRDNQNQAMGIVEKLNDE